MLLAKTYMSRETLVVSLHIFKYNNSSTPAKPKLFLLSSVEKCSLALLQSSDVQACTSQYLITNYSPLLMDLSVAHYASPTTRRSNNVSTAGIFFDDIELGVLDGFGR